MQHTLDTAKQCKINLVTHSKGAEGQEAEGMGIYAKAEEELCSC